MMKTGKFLAVLLGCAALPLAMPVTWTTAHAQDKAATGSYTLTKVTFKGNVQVPTAELLAALPVQVGQTIDQAGAKENVAAIGQVYQKHNVGTNITQSMTIIHHTKAIIAYTFVEQAPLAPTVVHVGITVDHVSVTGNARIKTPAILAAANIKPGQTVTNEAIKAAQDAISALYKKSNIGSMVSTDWTNTTPQHVDMVFKVTEKADE
jgi:outer membrane protein assembly factor BamA